jgi:phage-related protein
MSTWKFAGVALEDYGIVSRVSDALKLPTKRSDNALIPLRDGRVFVKKNFDQRKITLGLDVVETSVAALETRMDALRTVFGIRSQALLEEKLANGAVRSVLAEVTGDLGVNRVSPGAVRLAVDFILADPYFRSPTLTSDETTVNLTSKNYTLINAGSAEERNMVITFTGPLNQPRLTNLTNSVWVGYNGTLSSGVSVVIDCAKYTALSGGSNVVGSIVHSGDPAFWVLMPGSNSLLMQTTSTTGGKVKIDFYPPHF